MKVKVNKKSLIIVGIVVGLLIVGMSIYYFVSINNKPLINTNNNSSTNNDKYTKISNYDFYREYKKIVNSITEYYQYEDKIGVYRGTKVSKCYTLDKITSEGYYKNTYNLDGSVYVYKNQDKTFDVTIYLYNNEYQIKGGTSLSLSDISEYSRNKVLGYLTCEDKN